jgi:hypothetical protein
MQTSLLPPATVVPNNGSNGCSCQHQFAVYGCFVECNNVTTYARYGYTRGNSNKLALQAIIQLQAGHYAGAVLLYVM